MPFCPTIHKLHRSISPHHKNQVLTSVIMIVNAYHRMKSFSIIGLLGKIHSKFNRASRLPFYFLLTIIECNKIISFKRVSLHLFGNIGPPRTFGWKNFKLLCLLLRQSHQFDMKRLVIIRTSINSLGINDTSHLKDFCRISQCFLSPLVIKFDFRSKFHFCPALISDIRIITSICGSANHLFRPSVQRDLYIDGFIPFGRFYAIITILIIYVRCLSLGYGVTSYPPFFIFIEDLVSKIFLRTSNIFHAQSLRRLLFISS